MGNEPPQLFLHKLQFKSERKSVFSFVLTKKWAKFLKNCSIIIPIENSKDYERFKLEKKDLKNGILIEQYDLLKNANLQSVFDSIILHAVHFSAFVKLGEIFNRGGIKPSTENNEDLDWLLSEIKKGAYRKQDKQEEREQRT
jgi:hypothetical protein